MRIFFTIKLLFVLNLLIFSQSGTFNLKISSSENGFAILPDQIKITNSDNTHSPVIIHDLKSNRFSIALENGTYLVSVVKAGFKPAETYFSISGSEVTFHIFLDPDRPDPLLKPDRISKLKKDNFTLLLGYVVDYETGEPLGSVTLRNDKTNITAATNANGYFEIFLPSSCDVRTFVDLTFDKLGYKQNVCKNFELFPNTDFVFTIRLNKGNASVFEHEFTSAESNCEGCSSKKVISDLPVTGFVLPLNIRVGRNCTGTNCTYAEVYSVETYCKYVLPAEVYACWGNLQGGMNSLQACAVSVRSYGIYYVYNPINPSLYDICDNTYCQYMGSVTSTNTNNAVNNTYRNILTNSSGVVRCEYSAENNNKGCGNGYSGTGSTWPCIYDPVCLNAASNGHGRGLCQWGSVRWATGTLVSSSSPCSAGAPHSYGTLSWLQILNHYYNVSPYNWNVVPGITGTINSSTCSPATANPCSTITVINNVTVTNQVSLMLGTSIAPAGTTNWISDPVHDVKITFPQGTGNYNRQFTIPCSVQPGNYDLLTAIWYDKDNNNQINAGDFVVNSKLTQNTLTITPTGITPIGTEIPKSFALGQNNPNPFNPSTLIRFDIPKSTYVVLIVYDALGKVVATLVNDKLKAGSYMVDWSAQELTSGVYFYRLATKDFTKTRKMILVK